MGLTNEAHQYLKRFRPLGTVWDHSPVLYNQMRRWYLKNASIEELREACRLCNTNIDGLMEILGL
jgi:hypothetical protein